MQGITDKLLEMQDLEYRKFSIKLIPDTKYEIIGVRAPDIKNLAKEIVKDESLTRAFLAELPHKYYEEYFIHGMILGKLKTDVKELLRLTDEFIGYIDNWAVCDSTSACLKALRKDKTELYKHVNFWLNRSETYAVRFALVNLIDNFLEDDFNADIFDKINALRKDEYYINIAVAWYYSVALVKQYQTTIKLIESKTLDKWIQNKSIQKACESYRVPDERKTYLRTLKIK